MVIIDWRKKLRVIGIGSILLKENGQPIATLSVILVVYKKILLVLHDCA